MTAFVISQILLWIVVIVLAFTVFALTRQIGVLHARIAPAGALSANSMIEVGDRAPNITEADINGRSIEIGAPTDKSTLLFFLSPDCPICSSLLPALKSSLQAEKDWLTGIFVSDGDEEHSHKKYIESHDLQSWPYIISQNVGLKFAVSKLPYAALVDERGIVRSLGMVNTREHLESLFNAKELGVASIQQYLQKNTA